MAYANFVPEIWSKKILRDLEKALVFGEGCTREYEGDIKQMGDQVHITTAGNPTIRTLTVANAAGQITAAETLAGSTQHLDIDQFNYFNFEVADVDRAQALPGLFEKLTQNAAYGLADAVDQYVASLVAGATDVFSTVPTLTAATTLAAIDTGIEALLENNVPKNADLEIIINPKIWTLLKQNYVGLATNNMDALDNGKVAKYGNVTIKLSNNVVKDANNIYHCPIRVRNSAMALAMQLSKTEAYRREDGFADALKGFNLYGAKIIKSAEIVDWNVKV